MENFKKSIKLIVAFILCFIFGFSVLGYLTGANTISYNGFAIDSEENLYLGFPEGKIKVFKDNQYVKTIFSGTNRGYDFTIVDGNKIYVYIAPQGYFLDLNGKRIENPTAEFKYFHEYRPDENEFVFSDDVIYKQKFNMGRTKIIKISNNEPETVYEMPLDDYIVKIILMSGYLFSFAIGAYLCYKKLIHTKKPNRNN